MDLRPLTKAPILAAIAALALTLSFAPSARAADPASLAIDASSCGPALDRELRERLRVELADRSVDVTPEPRAAPTTKLEVRGCADATSAELVVHQGETVVSRTVDLKGVTATSRARVLALTAVELLREALAAPHPTAPPPPIEIVIQVQTPAPVAPPAIPPPPPAPPKPAPPPIARPPSHESVALELGAEMRAFPGGPAGLFGARLGAAIALGSHLAVTLDAGGAAGTYRDPLGLVRSTAFGGAAGLAAVARPGADVVFLVGPRIELDAVTFVGVPARAGVIGSSASGALVALTLDATLRVRTFGPLYLFGTIEAGYAVRAFEARADDRAATAFDGAIGGLQVGLGWAPGSTEPLPRR